MASVKSDISLKIKNNLNRSAKFSILGGKQDPSNGQANAKTIYEWDLSAETFANTNVVKISASTIDDPTIIEYVANNQDGAITDLQTVVNLLNSLNLGIFNLDGNTIWIIDDINIFGNIEVLISIGFDINVLVQDAYNYFDPLGKTSLVDFQAQYTSVIQHAVDTIPDFVDFVNSQGWSLCYPTNASEIDILRTDSRSIYIITDTSGVLSTTEYTNASINVTGFDNALMYAPDVNAFKNIDNLVFQAPLVPSNDAYIFKYIFELGVFITFDSNPAGNNGFQFLDPSYFPSPTDFSFSTFTMPPFGTNQLDLYGLEFPKLNIQSGEYTISASSSSNDIDLLNVGGNVVFDTLGQSSSIYLIRLREIASNNIDVLFSSLTLIGDNQSLVITTSDNAQQVINLDADFNTKFNYGLGLSGQILSIGADSPITGSIINYNDDSTPLNLKFKNIYFNNSVTNNLPPIGTGGGQIGFTSGTDYSLYLSLLEQSNLPARSMEYFNNWFYELGTQDFLSQYNANVVGGLGTILTATLNTFVLSGQGYYGYHALIDCGFTITTPFGAIKSNVLTFTINESALCYINTSGDGVNSPFEVTSAQKGLPEVVTSSVSGVGTLESISFPAPINNPNNVIFTIDPTVNCNSVYIGSPSNLFDAMSTFIVGNGVFNAGVDLGTFLVVGLTITLTYSNTARGDAYGLFQRDFSGLNGNNISTQLSIRKYKINTTDILNTLVEPYGSNALFNIATNGINPSVRQIRFQQCQFGTYIYHFVDNPRPLEILLPIGVRCENGINISSCDFNFRNLSTPTTEVHFNINNDSATTPTKLALLGSSEIVNCRFDDFGGEKIILEADYNGVGDSINDLEISNNPTITTIELVNTSTATPPPCSLTINSNTSLNTVIFENYNLTSINVGSLPFVTEFRVSGNNLSPTFLNDIIIVVDNNGLTNGNLDYSNQTGGASPDIGISGTAYNNLISKGWTVLGNPPV